MSIVLNESVDPRYGRRPAFARPRRRCAQPEPSPRIDPRPQEPRPSRWQSSTSCETSGRAGGAPRARFPPPLQVWIYIPPAAGPAPPRSPCFDGSGREAPSCSSPRPAPDSVSYRGSSGRRRSSSTPGATTGASCTASDEARPSSELSLALCAKEDISGALLEFLVWHELLHHLLPGRGMTRSSMTSRRAGPMRSGLTPSS
jgi:hypothetical protein